MIAPILKLLQRGWFISALIILATLPACNLTKKVVSGNQALLDRNKVKGADKPELRDIRDYIRYRPNRTILGIFKYKLWFYRLGSIGYKDSVINAQIDAGDDIDPETGKKKKKKGRLRRWVRESLGEPPVYLDTSLIELTQQNLEQYLVNHGFFDGQVTYTVKNVLNRATVTYIVEPGPAFKYGKIEYLAMDRTLNAILQQQRARSTLDSGETVNYQEISDERDRITNELRRQGFFYFNKEFIDIKLDTTNSGAPHTADLRLVVRNNRDFSPHEKQYIGQVIVTIIPDPNLVYEGTDSLHYSDIVFYMNGYPLLPSVLWHNILINRDSFYNQRRVEITYSRLVELNIFKFVNIEFSKSPADSNTLDVYITLIPNKKREYSIEPQALTSDQTQQITMQNTRVQTFGVANTFQYRNKNVFKNAAMFQLNLRASLEAQLQKDGGKPGFFRNLVRSGFETSVNGSLIFPRLLLLPKANLNPNNRSTKTAINVSYIYESNPDFTRKVLPANFTWQFNKRNRISWFITPFEVSYNLPNASASLIDSFKSNPSYQSNLYLRNAFTPYLVVDQRLTLIYNGANQKKKGYFYIKTNMLEIGGNGLFLISKLSPNWPRDSNGTYTLFGVKYYQYAKSDIDIRYNYRPTATQAFVVRFNTGLGWAYGNSPDLPFERRFFIGGTNSLRAWKPRGMGPGTFNSPSVTLADRVGEIIIQTNAEWRFRSVPSSIFEWAVFLDAGNIWLRQPSANYPGGEFKFPSFMKEMALNTGFGMRLDFSYFLLRLDWGIPLFDPAYPAGDRWVIKTLGAERWSWIRNQTLISVGVGYPF